MAVHRGYFAILDANRKFVMDNILSMTAPEIASRLGVSVSSVRNYRLNRLNVDARDIGRKYTEEMLSWLRENMTDYVSLAKQFNARYGMNVDVNRIRNVCNKNGFGNRDFFRPELVQKMRERALEDYPIGTERASSGWVYIKVGSEPQSGQGVRASPNWKLKHYLIYEKEYGAIPPDHKVVFIDHDRANFNLSNLACITVREQLLLTKCGWLDGNSRAFPVRLAWVRLNLLLHDKKEKLRGTKND